MYAGKDLSPVTPGESVDIWFDFALDFRPGSIETIASAVFSLSVVATETGATEDTDPSGQLSGSPSIEESDISGRNTVAVQRVDSPVDGNRYLIECLATTDAGQKLALHSRFWCRAAS